MLSQEKRSPPSAQPREDAEEEKISQPRSETGKIIKKRKKKKKKLKNPSVRAEGGGEEVQGEEAKGNLSAT